MVVAYTNVLECYFEQFPCLECLKKLSIMDTIQNYTYVYRNSPSELLGFTTYQCTEMYLAQVQGLFFMWRVLVCVNLSGKIFVNIQKKWSPIDILIVLSTASEQPDIVP
jgi:hypothetical protein